MITIEKADTSDYRDIQAVARVAFPATYAEILTEGQLAYMMEWMYSTESLLRQMQEEGHTRGTHLLYRTRRSGHAGGLCIHTSGRRGSVPLGKNLCPARTTRRAHRTQAVRTRGTCRQGDAPGTVPPGAERQSLEPCTGILRTDGHEETARRRLPHRRGILHE